MEAGGQFQVVIGNNVPIVYAEIGQISKLTGDANEGVTPQASGAAYTESSRGLPLPAATALFDIDSGTDALVRQNPANAGTLRCRLPARRAWLPGHVAPRRAGDQRRRTSG